MKKIAYIVDVLSNNNYGKCTGHYIPVAKNFYRILHEISDVIIAAGPSYGSSITTPIMRLPYSVSSAPGIINNVLGKLKTLANCRFFFKRVDESCKIIWQHSSVVMSNLGIWLWSKKNIDIYIIQYSGVGINSKVKNYLFQKAKSKIKGVICPNDEVGEAYGLPYCVVPDYIYTGEFNSIIPIPYAERVYDICIMGRFNKDKGVVEAINKLRNSAYKVVVAGHPDNEDYGREIESAAKDCQNIELHLGFIETDDYNNYIRNSRYCILNYQGEYSVRSSGVVFDIIFNGVPVIGTHCSALQFVEDFKVGYLFDSLADLNFERLFEEGLYSDYLRNIDSYREYHKIYINKIRNFIGL